MEQTKLLITDYDLHFGEFSFFPRLAITQVGEEWLRYPLSVFQNFFARGIPAASSHYADEDI
jgi:hypothetical protein